MRRRFLALLLASAALAVGFGLSPSESVSAGDYLLPIAAGDKLTATGTPGGDHGWAYDFDRPDSEGWEVVAARAGTVLGLRSDSTTQCNGLNTRKDGSRLVDCWAEANFVLIDHGDGTSALYLHLAPNSVLVGEDEKVAAGTPLGEAGDTGYSNNIHLHFQVGPTPSATRREAGGAWWWTTPTHQITWSDPDVLKQDRDGELTQDRTYTSSNSETTQVGPSGRWVEAPANNSAVSGDFTVVAQATKAPSGAKITKINFTVWSSTPQSPAGRWVIVCSTTIAKPDDVYSCPIDVDAIQGDFRISFDVYDEAGRHTLAPGGVRNLKKQNVPEKRGPSAPPNASIAAVDSQTVAVSWSRSSGAVDGYRVYGTGGTFLIQTSASFSAPVRINGFKAGDRVCVNVVAFAGELESSPPTHAGCADLPGSGEPNDPDPDGDGIPNSRDECDNSAENFNGYADTDGCPDTPPVNDPDPDGDGIPDSRDECDNSAENFNSYQDIDGCPDTPPVNDPDPDNDGIPNSRDNCDNSAEDRDNFEDSDGCPEPGPITDPDPDGDGYPNSRDRECPNSPETFNGYQDGDGCPDEPPVNYSFWFSLNDYADGHTFAVGSVIGFCYELTPGNVPYTLRLSKSSNGGPFEYITAWNDTGGGDCLQVGTVAGPAGPRTYLAEAIVNGAVVAQDTTVIVVGGGGGGQEPGTVQAPEWVHVCYPDSRGVMFWAPVAGSDGFRIWHDGTVIATLSGGSSPGTAFHSYDKLPRDLDPTLFFVSTLKAGTESSHTRGSAEPCVG